jgi:hypothetical protein
MSLGVVLHPDKAKQYAVNFREIAAPLRAHRPMPLSGWTSSPPSA